MIVDLFVDAGALCMVCNRYTAVTPRKCRIKKNLRAKIPSQMEMTPQHTQKLGENCKSKFTLFSEKADTKIVFL